MRKTILGILLAATAVTPTIASAQDTDQARREHWREGRGERAQQPRGPEQQASQQPQGQRTYAQPQTQPQAAPQQQQQQQRGGWNGQRSWNGAQQGDYRARSGEARQEGRWQRPGSTDQMRQGYAPGAATQQPYGGRQGGFVSQGNDRDARAYGQRDGRNYGQHDYGQRDGRDYGQREYGQRDNREQGRRDYAPGNQWQRGEGNRYDGARSAQNGQWNRGWRSNDRYDWSSYRSANRGAFHLPRYYAPSNWQYGYRRFSPGITLSSILFGSNYWIDDPYDYRLPPAYGPYRWVRYYNDALLVDIRTGYVVDTVYDIFW